MKQSCNKFRKITPKICILVLCSSRTSVPLKLGLFNAKIHNENGRYIHRLIYQVNEQDLLCHSIWNVSLILATSLLEGGLKWSILTSFQRKNTEYLLCFASARSITFNITCNVTALIVLCSRKVSTL